MTRPSAALSRRHFLSLAGGAGAVLGLTACAGQSAPTGGGGAPGAAGFPITVRHSLGETVIERPPTRVVTLGWMDADPTLALQVRPVGIYTVYTSMRSGVGPWAQPRLGDPPPRAWPGGPLPYEDIAALGPDLILYVSGPGDRSAHDLLSKIAPTVSSVVGAKPYAPAWQDATQLIARSLGVPDRGKALVGEVSNYLHRIGTEHPHFAGRTLSYLDVYPGGVAVGGQDATVNQVMRQIGFVQPPGLEGPRFAGIQNKISPELLNLVDADVLLIFGYGSSWEQLMSTNPTLANLPAVKAGRAHQLTDLSLSAPSVLSIPWGVDRLVPALDRMLT